MPILTATAATSGVASWSENEDVVAGAVSTDNVTSGTSQSTYVRTGSGTDADSGTVTIGSGNSSSATAAQTSGMVLALSGAVVTAGNDSGASGQVALLSGDSVAATAHTGGNTGACTIGSGSTECTDAGGTGGDSGAVTVASGDCNSAAGVSGASGAVTVASGTSDDGNTGAVTVRSGVPAAAGVSGDLTLTTGAPTGAGTSGRVVISGGATGGGGTQGHVLATGVVNKSSSGSAINGARTLSFSDSGGAFSVSQGAAFDIDLPNPTLGAGLRFIFFLGTAGPNSVTVTVAGGAATFIGTIVNDITSVIPATGATLTFVTGTAAIGDSIEIYSISSTIYGVRAFTSAAGGITIA